MNRRVRLVFLLILLLVGFEFSAFGVEIIYPSDKSIIVHSDFLILKAGGAEQLVVGINGVKSEPIDITGEDYRAAFGDFLILQPEFDPGKNTLTAAAYVGGKQVDFRSVSIYFRSDPAAIPPREFRPFVMHTPEQEALCQPCHQMRPDKIQLRAETEQDNPCAGCHRSLLQHEYVHGPAGVYQCVDCHDPESRPSRYQLRAQGAELCNECHFDKVDAFKVNKYVHGPVGAGYCDTCHDSHASAYSGQLLMPVNELCLGCHRAVTREIHVARGITKNGHPLGGVPDPSRPGQMLNCASCHDPHGGMNTYFFRNGLTDRFALCQYCHKK